MQSVYGDAQLFERNGDGYVRLPWRNDDDAPLVCDGEPMATVSTPDAVECFAGTAVRHLREHVVDLRRRYQKHNRLDRVKAMGGQEQRWMRDINHQMSRQIGDLAAAYERPMMVFGTLDGIRSRVGGS